MRFSKFTYIYLRKAKTEITNIVGTFSIVAKSSETK